MARRPFSLSAYLALTRSQDGKRPAGIEATRPAGRIIWLHASRDGHAGALSALAQRLSQQHPDITFLRTGTWPDTLGQVTEMPDETLSDARAFLDYWRPTLCLWSGHGLRPALMEAAHEAQLPCLLVNAGEAPFTTPGPRWLPDAAPATLMRFETVFCTSRDAERQLRKLGLEASRVVRAGTLTEAAPPLDCPPELHEEVAAALGGRPVWLAARLRAGEMRAVFEAHAAAGRLAPRLLLVVVPHSSEDADAAWVAADETGLRTCFWDAGDMPDDLTQIVLCEGTDELGLWYRVAPLAFLGGSLVNGEGGTDPFEAAALGSAILYGPNVGQYLASYSRLVEAGAARIIRDASSLSTAVSQIIAPDRAAAMAHAGWDVVTAGAKTEDHIIERISQLLDARRAHKARS